MRETLKLFFIPFLGKVHALFTSGSTRTILAKKNIAASFVLKVISILISLQVVPLTINYINPTRYGIWLTLSSCIAWLSFFDLGFANGFRNRFAEAKARGEYDLAKQYVSTTYIVLAILFGFLFVLAFSVNHFLNWSTLLNVSVVYSAELQTVFGLLVCFFCLNIIAEVFSVMLQADQKPALASLFQTGGQLLAFIAIYILTKSTTGSLINLALAFSSIPCIWLIVVSFFMFRTKRYKRYSPSFSSIRLRLTKSILGMGSQFFIIMMSMLLIFQFINIIISREEGPDAVTQYNIAYKYFNVLNMVFTIILTPFWSAFTDAYTKKDYQWMRNVQYKLERIWLLCIPVAILMLFCSNWLYVWWIGDSVKISFSLSLSVMLYILFMTLGNVYMYMINGIGKVRLQLIVYLSFAVVSLPLLSMCCKSFGVEGILIVPAIVYLFQALLGKIQITRLASGKARGIWNK